MRENKQYLLRKQAASKPHKIGVKVDEEESTPKVTPPERTITIEPIPEAKSPPIVAQPVATPQPVRAQPTPVTPLVAPIKPMEPSPEQGKQAAIALARSKIASIYGYSYGQESGEAEPGQTPVIAQGYAAEEQLQEIMDPAHAHHAQPDHQLPVSHKTLNNEASSTNHHKQYSTFSIPGQKPIEPTEKSTTAIPEPVIEDIPKKSPAKKSKQKTNNLSIKNLRKKIDQKHKREKREEVGIKRFRRFVPVGILISVVVMIMNNQLVYGQISYYVTPGNRVATPSIIESSIDNVAPPEPKVIIPKINVDVPVNYGVNDYSEEAIQAGLENGVVHYANTGLPGEVGNNVIFGHSTNNFWNSGKYKTAFVLLDRLELEDTFEIHYESKRYIYQIYEKKVINPDDFSIITQGVTEPIVTLVTCTPPGTSWQRLVIQARQISPEPEASSSTKSNTLPDGIEGDIPSNAKTPWESLTGWLW